MNLSSHSFNTPNLASQNRADVQDYVAQLQLHMALQARNLVPNITQANSSREKLLQESQSTLEKLASRQLF